MTNDPSKSEIPAILDWLSRLHGEKSLRKTVAPYYDTLLSGELPWASLDKSPKDTLTLLILDTIEAGLNPPERLRTTLEHLARTYVPPDEPEIEGPEKTYDEYLEERILEITLRDPPPKNPVTCPNCGGTYLQQTAVEIHTRRTRAGLLQPSGLLGLYWHLREIEFPRFSFRKPAVTRVNLITGKLSHKSAYGTLYQTGPVIAIEFQCSICSTTGTPLSESTLVIWTHPLSTNRDWIYKLY